MRIYIAGAAGMVGSALTRRLASSPEYEVIAPSREELDLTDRLAVFEFFGREHIDCVFLAAARVGGILANSQFPVDFLLQNLSIQTNVISAAHEFNVDRLVFFGSSCIYPKEVDQPIKENALLSGKLELTNEPYAIAKISGIKLCESYNRQFGRDFRSLMPTNLYGPGDNFHPDNSHVIPGMIQRFHTAKLAGDKEVTVWGTGKPRREFLHVDDLADAAIFIMEQSKQVYLEALGEDASHINVGVGKDCAIKEIAEMVSEVVGFRGALIFDTSKPDGTYQKLLDTSKLSFMGWESSTALKDGLDSTYLWYKENLRAVRSS